MDQTTTTTDPRDPAFLQRVRAIRERLGRTPLEDEELTLLALEEISRSYTREEKQYRS